MVTFTPCHLGYTISGSTEYFSQKWTTALWKTLLWDTHAFHISHPQKKEHLHCGLNSSETESYAKYWSSCCLTHYSGISSSSLTACETTWFCQAGDRWWLRGTPLLKFRKESNAALYLLEPCSDHSYSSLEDPCLCIQTSLQTEHFHAPLPPPSFISQIHLYSSLTELMQLVQLQIQAHLPLYLSGEYWEGSKVSRKEENLSKVNLGRKLKVQTTVVRQKYPKPCFKVSSQALNLALKFRSWRVAEKILWIAV